MNYYYDINLNFNKKLYKFYEWSSSDNITCFKKVPLIKVRQNILKKIYANNFKIDKKVLNNITNYSKNNKYIECIFCDNNNCIAIQFDKEGKSVLRSSLLIPDENNIIDITNNIKSQDINIDIIDEINLTNELRQEVYYKKIINNEIKQLYKNKENDKLRYLYFELFNKDEIDIKKIFWEMKENLKLELSKNHYKLYKIIRLSHSK